MYDIFLYSNSWECRQMQMQIQMMMRAMGERQVAASMRTRSCSFYATSGMWEQRKWFLVLFALLCDKKYVNANKREYKMVIKSMTRCFTKFQQGACPLCWQHWQQQQIKSITMPLNPGTLLGEPAHQDDNFYGARDVALKSTCRIRNNSITFRSIINFLVSALSSQR